MIDTPDADRLARRYGRPTAARRWIVPVLAGVLVVAFGAWLAWTVVDRSTPRVSSQLVTWSVVDEHTARAVVEVQVDEGARKPSCLLRAYAEDHTTVGDESFTPTDGRQSVTIRTERRATSVEKVGCTSIGQNDPR